MGHVNKTNMPYIIEITDFNVPELDVYARLTEPQLLHIFEPGRGIFIAESPRVIERALNAGYEPLSMLVEKKHIAGEARQIIARCKETPVFTADFDVLTKLTGYQLTRGVLCAMRRKALADAEEICRDTKRIAVLENIVNPTNIGAIFRSAAALGMDAVLLTPACSDPLYRRAIRVSMGTVFQIPWTYLKGEDEAWPGRGVDLLHELGFLTVAMALEENALDITDSRLAEADRLAVVLGTEGDGLAAGTIAACDDTVCIPMSHGVDSLNVAAASAVAFWQLGNKNIH